MIPQECKTASVLLIDDNPIELKLFEVLVTRASLKCHVVGETNSTKALETLSTGEDKPDLILLDLNMPKLDGRRFLKALQNDPATEGIPVVIHTNSEAQDDQSTISNLGAKGYMVKPFSLEKFEKSIQEIKDLILVQGEDCVHLVRTG